VAENAQLWIVCYILPTTNDDSHDDNGMNYGITTAYQLKKHGIIGANSDVKFYLTSAAELLQQIKCCRITERCKHTTRTDH